MTEKLEYSRSDWQLSFPNNCIFPQFLVWFFWAGHSVGGWICLEISHLIVFVICMGWGIIKNQLDIQVNEIFDFGLYFSANFPSPSPQPKFVDGIWFGSSDSSNSSLLSDCIWSSFSCSQVESVSLQTIVLMIPLIVNFPKSIACWQPPMMIIHSRLFICFLKFFCCFDCVEESCCFCGEVRGQFSPLRYSLFGQFLVFLVLQWQYQSLNHHSVVAKTNHPQQKSVLDPIFRTSSPVLVFFLLHISMLFQLVVLFFHLHFQSQTTADVQ